MKKHEIVKEIEDYYVLRPGDERKFVNKVYDRFTELRLDSPDEDEWELLFETCWGMDVETTTKL